MPSFIDITGASGAVYRFRSAGHPALLPVEAGNFVIVHEADAENLAVCCGTALSLARAGPLQDGRANEFSSGEVYVRLNVSRAAWLAEHADIVAALKPKHIFDELGDGDPK